MYIVPKVEVLVLELCMYINHVGICLSAYTGRLEQINSKCMVHGTVVYIVYATMWSTVDDENPGYFYLPKPPPPPLLAFMFLCFFSSAFFEAIVCIGALGSCSI